MTSHNNETCLLIAVQKEDGNVLIGISVETEGFPHLFIKPIFKEAMFIHQITTIKMYT